MNEAKNIKKEDKSNMNLINSTTDSQQEVAYESNTCDNVEKKISKSVKSNYIYNAIYQILVIIIPIIVTPYISRVLHPEGVGQYSFTISLITYFTTFANLGFGYYAQREIAKYQDDKIQQSKVFWEINLCRMIPVVISLVVHFVLVGIGVYGDYTTLMLILSINIIAVACDISFFFQGNEDFGKLVLVNIIIKVLFTSLIFVCVKTENDIWVYVLLHSVNIIVSNLVLWFFLKGKLINIKWKEIKFIKHLKPSLTLFLPSIAIALYTILDKSLIGIITKSDMQNGFYEQAEKIVKMAMTLLQCLGLVLIPRNSHEFKLGNIEKVKENNYKAFHFLWLLGFPMAFGMCLVASNAVPWFLGDGYEMCIGLIQIFSVLIIIISISHALGTQYLIPCKKDKKYTIAIVSGAITNLIVNIPLIIWFKAVGAAISTIISELIVAVIMCIMVRKELSLKKIFKSMIKPLIASVVMFAIVFPITKILTCGIIQTLLIVVLGMVTYGVVICVLKDKMVTNYLKSFINKFVKKNKQK